MPQQKHLEPDRHSVCQEVSEEGDELFRAKHLMLLASHSWTVTQAWACLLSRRCPLRLLVHYEVWIGCWLQLQHGFQQWCCGLWHLEMWYTDLDDCELTTAPGKTNAVGSMRWRHQNFIILQLCYWRACVCIEDSFPSVKPTYSAAETEM